MGRVRSAGDSIALGHRPERWLILSPPGPAGAAATAWQAVLAGAGTAVDLSSGLSVFRLVGPHDAIRSALARGCRLDLDGEVFPAGHVAATIIAQVSVILARLADGMLLLTPSTTARHFREWLGEHRQDEV
jgi:heterotetrameric sarcosine oxidase gamma subunit